MAQFIHSTAEGTSELLPFGAKFKFKLFNLNFNFNLILIKKLNFFNFKIKFFKLLKLLFLIILFN